MYFGLLGPIWVADQHGDLEVHGAKPRAALAVLLLHGNRVVSVSQMVDGLWADEPPRVARMAVQGHVKRLRHMLGPSFAARLETRPSGYRLTVDEEELDLYRVNRLVRQGRSAAANAEWEHASALLAEALALWRGEPLEDVPQSPALRNEAERLTELRLQLFEWRIDADLRAGCCRAGRCAQLLPELRALTATYPLQERFHGQLMLALHQCGRRAEALAAFQTARGVLVEELGVEPCSQLQALHRQLVRAESCPDRGPAPESIALSPPVPRLTEHMAYPSPDLTEPMAHPSPDLTEPVAYPSPGPTAPRPLPNQLPIDVADFTGRVAEQATLMELLDSLALDQTNGPAGPVPIVVITGQGGVGKTALAVHSAHRVDQHYPDGRLFVALNGSGDTPATTGLVLRRLLRTLGVDPAEICEDVEECVALYRSILAGRRMLIVIDDAVSSEQVRALLPGTPGCAVIVTSRGCLLDLDGARWLVLRELDEEQACVLMGRIIGAARAAAEPEAVAEVVRLCGYLPLAIRIVGARLAVRPSWSVRDVVRSLTEEPGRLDTLSDDCGQRLSHALGRGSLTAEEAGALRLLAASSIRDLSLDSVSALLGTGIPESRRIAEHLVDLHQLYSRCQDRYYYPDLHHLYAREQGGRTEPVEWQRSAVRRLSERYLDTIRDALLALHDPEPPARPQRFPDAATALAWLEAEHANIIALIEENSRAPIAEPETACALLCHLQSCEYGRADLVRSGAAPIVAQGSDSQRH